MRQAGYISLGFVWMGLGLGLWAGSFAVLVEGAGYGLGVMQAKAGQALMGGGLGLVLDAVARPDTKPDMIAVAIMALAFTASFGA